MSGGGSHDQFAVQFIVGLEKRPTSWQLPMPAVEEGSALPRLTARFNVSGSAERSPTKMTLAAHVP